MGSRVLAQLLVAGATVVFRAAAQAWHQALANAQKSGVAQEGVKAAGRAAGLSIQEAQMILGVENTAPWGDVVKRFKHLYDVNEKHGSFYLQSKIYRAKEALEQDYEASGRKPAGSQDEAAEQPKTDDTAKPQQ